MNLFLDVGNTRLKWRLSDHSGVVDLGVLSAEQADALERRLPADASLDRIVISTVISEERRRALSERLEASLSIKPVFYWAEKSRAGLVNAYSDPSIMGADRWHAMLGARFAGYSSFAVVDAGSAITVDYVRNDGKHLGGYILPGKKMMLRSLKTDAARIGFDEAAASQSMPGTSTTECVLHGLPWLWQGLARNIEADCLVHDLSAVLVTGGDAQELVVAGLSGIVRSELVLDGLEFVDRMERSR